MSYLGWNKLEQKCGTIRNNLFYVPRCGLVGRTRTLHWVGQLHTATGLCWACRCQVRVPIYTALLVSTEILEHEAKGKTTHAELCSRLLAYEENHESVTMLSSF